VRQIQRRRMWLRLGEPLLPDRAGPWALALTACCVIITVVIGLLVARQRVPLGIDGTIDTPIISAIGSHRLALGLVISLGSLGPAVMFSAVIVIGCLLAGRLNGAILGLLAVPIADGLDEKLLKPLFHRADLGFLSYPSGHTTAVVTLGAVATVLLAFPSPRSARPVLRRVLIPVAAGLIGCAVAVALIGLRWHYFSDTVGGAAVAIGTVSGLTLLLDLPVVRRLLARVAPDRSEDQRRPDDSAADAAGQRLAGPRAG
jgi:membrane-associated phospholipid phosphatase